MSRCVVALILIVLSGRKSSRRPGASRLAFFLRAGPVCLLGISVQRRGLQPAGGGGGGDGVADNAIKNLGKNAVHEGKHGLTDSERGREDNTRSERLDNEIGAYTVQGYYQKALRFSTSSDDPWTYGGGLSEKNILNKANASVNQACGSETGGSCGN
jgi:hypothetical protein